MTQKHKFMIVEGMMIFAFAYAAKGYHCAALAAAVSAVLYAWYTAADAGWKRRILPLLIAGTAEALLIRGSGLTEMVPSLPAVSFCALLTAVLQLPGNWKKLHSSIRRTVLMYLLFILLTLLLPSPAYGEAGTMMIVSLLYLPWIAVYSFCRVRDILAVPGSSGLKEGMHVR